jgi:hypothetical protein
MIFKHGYFICLFTDGEIPKVREKRFSESAGAAIAEGF